MGECQLGDAGGRWISEDCREDAGTRLGRSEKPIFWKSLATGSRMKSNGLCFLIISADDLDMVRGLWKSGQDRDAIHNTPITVGLSPAWIHSNGVSQP